MLFVVYAVEIMTLHKRNVRDLYVQRGLFVVQIYTTLHWNAHCGWWSLYFDTCSKTTSL